MDVEHFLIWDINQTLTVKTNTAVKGNVYNGVRLTSIGIKVYDVQLRQDVCFTQHRNAFIVFEDVK